MHKPDSIEHLYLDFDGFFASVEQQLDPRLRGRPVGVVPYEGGKTCIIAASREAKAAGVKSIMDVAEARRICPDLLLVPQQPAMYRRAHNALVAEIESVVPVDAVKSIDELSCRLDEAQRADPEGVSVAIKAAIARNVGPFITCSIGFAANRHLAKIACKVNKPDGLTIWHPGTMPGPLFAIPLEDIPGVGRRMAARLALAGIHSTRQLYETQPKQMRALWRNVTGERLWYALHGYSITAPASGRGMFGHARVLPPDQRRLADAELISRLLLTKAARRMRRAGYACSGLWLWVRSFDSGWSGEQRLPTVHDDAALLQGLSRLWHRLRAERPGSLRVMRVGVTLFHLSAASARQLDWIIDDDAERQRWERIGASMDALNSRFSSTVVSIGPWQPPKGGNVGGKIAFTRIPSAEDFW
ncbi:Y-family DNA polymerase [Sandaracinobacteroides sp. A072]|uniref:Y-family DNA polymerase n=1 Tax=Sandaracinobacteroides sp. A072 TaxID=3461146 RepID=UPI004042429E